MSNILVREEIKLTKWQDKMVISGWGTEAFESSVVEKITYFSDGLKVKGYLAYPKENSGRKFPCIIWNRGGYKENGAIDSFNARGMFGNMAAWGYVIFASQYRGNDGGEGEEELGGAEVNDVLNLIPLADEIPFADNKIWGIEGWSRGGMMTFLTLLKNPDFRCAVLSGAVSDLKSYAEKNEDTFRKFRERFGEETFEAKLTNRSAIYFTEKLPVIPYLLLHGGADETVSPLQTIELAKKFLALNIPYRLKIYEGGGHFIKNHKPDVDQERKSWYSKYLQPG
jgi:dipeptidyl aminopeptidase/acylaminoacyl peptidase